MCSNVNKNKIYEHFNPLLVVITQFKTVVLIDWKSEMKIDRWAVTELLCQAFDRNTWTLTASPLTAPKGHAHVRKHGLWKCDPWNDHCSSVNRHEIWCLIRCLNQCFRFSGSVRAKFIVLFPIEQVQHLPKKNVVIVTCK